MTDPTNAVFTDVAVLKNEVARMSEFFGKLDTAIEKISDLSNSITRMLAVHDERLDKQDETNAELYKSMDTVHAAVMNDIRDLYRKLNETNTEMNSTLSTIRSHVVEQMEKRDKEYQKRISSLERWRWIIFGGGAVLYSLLAYFGPKVFDLLVK